MKKHISLLGVACVIATSGCSRNQEAEVEAPAPVQVAAVTQDTVRRSVTADGTLFPVDQWNVMPKITAPVVSNTPIHKATVIFPIELIFR